MTRALTAVAIVLATPTAAVAHENGWNTWADWKAAHPLEAPELDESKSLTPASTEALVEFEGDQRARWKRWVEFDTAYWDELAERRQEVTEPAIQVLPEAVTSAPASSPLCDWSCIQCESGGDPQAVSPSGTYWGLYQFDYGTWVGHGGDPDSYGNASADEQHTVASRISYDAWPNC